MKCFCCTHDHKDPTTGAKLPCDRDLVFSIVKKWYDSPENDETYLESFTSHLVKGPVILACVLHAHLNCQLL